MMSFKKEGVTMVFVSHSIPAIVRICDRVMWIDDHGIKMLGNTNDVADSYRNFSKIR